VVDADRIIVLDAGRVLEQGTYSDLMSLGGHFHQLAIRQEL
jgi:ATP-binding cassette subfamily B protein